jgi:hypothetical protein
MSPFRIALRVVPGALALLELLLVVALLHVPIAHAMRERGLPEWRVRDTALVSPLCLVGTLLFLLSVNHGMARFAFDTAQGQSHPAHAGLLTAVGVAGIVIAAFGARAVGKLY